MEKEIKAITLEIKFQNGSKLRYTIRDPFYEESLDEELEEIGNRLEKIYEGKQDKILFLSGDETVVYLPKNVILNSIIELVGETDA